MPPARSLLVLPLLAVAAHAAPEAFEVGPANKDQLPRGKEADGIIGDLVLRNDKVEAVISGNLPLRRANMSTFYGASGITPGCLYDLTLRGTNNGEFARTAGIGYPDAQGRYAFALPPGDFEVTFDDQGRDSVTRAVSVKAKETQTLDSEMSMASAVQFDIRDEAGKSLPCKVQFHALEGTEVPNLGPENRAHGCADQYHSEKGQFRVQLAPGKYRIVVTRGIEYSHIAREITLEPGNTLAFSGSLKRLVDTTGWVSTDYHNHSTPSGDNTCGTDDRIINLAAEHIEFAPTTEHNRLYDWRPHIEKLGLSEFIQTVPGLELTGSAAHFNAFPFKPEPFIQDNGAPVWNPDPRITAITLRDWQGAEPDRWVQINHPDMVANFIDRDGDGRTDGGFLGLAMLIDGLETQNFSKSTLLDGMPIRVGKNKMGKDSVLYSREFIWLQMLNRGHRYAAMAVCDAHSVWGNGVGGWRMYMPSQSDEPAKIDWRENSRHAKAGHSIITSGPFLSVSTDTGTGPGDTTRAPGGVKLKVKVQCTDWIDIDRVQVLVNGRARKELNFTRESHPEWFGKGVVKFERTLDVPLSEDAHLIVVAAGEKSDLSIGYGTSTQSKMQPIAYNNPIFVDVDGNGFTPNGDTLGWELPVKKISVKEARRMIEQRGPKAADVAAD